MTSREDFDENFWEKHAVVRPQDPLRLVEDFQELLDQNPSEAVVQDFLEHNPWLLSEQFPHCHYILPRFNLGGVYLTDFIAPERSSGGTQWMLVEIERPDAQLVTKGGDYAETVRVQTH